MPDPAICVRPPAYAYVAAHGDLLTQLGATKVEATDSMSIKLTYTDNAKAANAAALLYDTVWGAKLAVDNQSLTPDAPTVTADGIADVLRGVAGLTVTNLQSKGPDSHSLISAVSSDSDKVTLLNDLVKANPAPGIFVSVRSGVRSPFAPTPAA